jgi:hypothetical protein
MARVLAIAPDLFFAAKIEETLAAAGHEVRVSPDPPADVSDADVVVADLMAVPPARLAGVGVPVLGFYRHTDTEVRQAAEAAGIALVVPRSRMAREMPDLLKRLLPG